MGRQASMDSQLVEDLMEIQAISHEWRKGDDVENAQHPPELQAWDRTERRMFETIDQIAHTWCERIDRGKAELPAVAMLRVHGALGVWNLLQS